MAFDFKLRSQVTEKGKTAFYAKLANSTEGEFFVGYRTKYKDRFGLYNANQSSKLVYKGVDYEAEFGFWAYFIEPTAIAESNGSFICLNTYDRAYFTFGFMQFAAHVANGDFIHFLKNLLALPNAKDYFPRLEIFNNRIFYVADSGKQTQLESNESSKGLMEYFNPSTNEVENQELICAARMIHWATNDLNNRKIQVSESINLYNNNLKKYHKRFNLEGYPAKVCFMICDILHQGRGDYDRIGYALDTNGNFEEAYDNLCSVGEKNYAERIRTVKKRINELESNNTFKKVYQSETNTFIEQA